MRFLEASKNGAFFSGLCPKPHLRQQMCWASAQQATSERGARAKVPAQVCEGRRRHARYKVQVYWIYGAGVIVA